MKIIVGLGNPGTKYEHTRHNAGFMAVDFYLKDHEAIKCESKFKGQICEMHFTAHRANTTPSNSPFSGGEALQESEDNRGAPPPKIGGVRGGITAIKTFFVKPQTFMNKSGEAVQEIMDFYKVDVKKDLLVIHDEVDLKFGFYKLAFDSRPAGHNGIKNIVEHLGTQEFHRIRIGVESRLSKHESPTDEFVLQNFTSDELETLDKDVLPKINKEFETFILM